MNLLLAEQLSSGWEINHPRMLVLSILIAFGIVYTLYRKERELVSNQKKWVLVTLRVLVLALLLLLFFEPSYVRRSETEVPSPVLVFIDKSKSMQVLAAEYSPEEAKVYLKKFGEKFNELSRFDQQKQLVADLEKGLRESHKFQVMGFGEEYSYISDAVSWDKTQALDNRSRLSECLRVAINKYRDEAISGIVIISDGNIEDIEAATQILGKLKNEIHKDTAVKVLGLGSAVVKPDLKLLSFSIPEIVIKSKDAVTFRASFSGRGMKADDPVTVKLFENDKELVDQRKDVKLSDGEVSYEITLNKAGKFKYHLKLESVPGEEVTENNMRTAFVTVKDEKLKVLYIEDFPRHDYRKLSQYLVRNDTLYETRVWLNEAQTNYKQLGSKNKELKQSPVITYSTFDSLWKGADVIFIGNIGARPFEASEFLEHLEKFVAKGGGLVFLAGPNNMPSSYSNNEIVKKLMPVYFGPADLKSDGGKTPFRFSVTAAGAKHPITKMKDPSVTKKIWRGAPPCQWFYRPLGVKASTKVLLEHPEDKLANEHDRNVPLFAVMPYGRGQVFYLGCDEMSRWSYLDSSEYIFNHFMGQLIQYMSSSKVRVGGLLEVDSDQIPLGDEISVTLHLDDPEETSDQTKTLKWAYEKGETQTFEVKRRSPESAIFEGKLKPEEKGIVNIWLKDKANAQQVAVTSFSRELEDNELNEKNMKLLAGDGEVLTLNSINTLVKGFKDNQIKHLEKSVEGLLEVRGDDKDKKLLITMILVFLSLLLGAEWWLRKRWHLL
jgi:hypothetical protein